MNVRESMSRRAKSSPQTGDGDMVETFPLEEEDVGN